MHHDVKINFTVFKNIEMSFDKSVICDKQQQLLQFLEQNGYYDSPLFFLCLKWQHREMKKLI